MINNRVQKNGTLPTNPDFRNCVRAEVNSLISEEICVAVNLQALSLEVPHGEVIS